MVDSYPVIEISDPGGEKSEPMGTKAKFWVMYHHRRWLFKYNRLGHGEDWSEKIAAEIGHRLAIKCANVDLARCAGESGVISQNFADDLAGERLVHGNELLNDYYNGSYPINSSYRVSQHCIPAVRDILSRYSVSKESGDLDVGVIKTLWHQFAGYLMLDALIGNTDRHHENWGLITRSILPGSLAILAPSFDHASSLGRELRDAARGEFLSGSGNRNIALYAKKGRSKIYPNPQSSKPLTPLEAFVNATTEIQEARHFWLKHLAAIDENDFATIIGQIPESRMSINARRFASALLVYNRDRLLRYGSD